MPDYTSSPYYNTAVAAATKYGIPTNLFIQQIGQESGFNPSAQNGAATGIAQFMPTTAASYGVNASDPTSSLYGAAAYDANLYSQYGSWQTALQKYGTTANGNGAAVNTLAQQTDASAASYAPTGGFLGWAASMDKQFPILGAIDNLLDINPNTSGSLTATNGPIATTYTGVTSLLSIVTDLPRMVTIVAGLILLIAGLFMLGARPAVQIVGQAKKTVGAVAELAA